MKFWRTYFTGCIFWLTWFSVLGRGRMYDNSCFHKQVCIMAEQGEGKIKATFCSFSRAWDSTSGGWRFIFLLSVWETELLTRQHHDGCLHELAVANLCLLVADGLWAAQVWALGTGMSPQRWGWLGPAPSVCVGSRKLSGHAKAAGADEQEECPTSREVVGCPGSRSNLVPA